MFDFFYSRTLEFTFKITVYLGEKSDKYFGHSQIYSKVNELNSLLR